MEYKDLEKINSGIKTTDIKGKDYAEVPQRVKAFRQLFPHGRIQNEMIDNTNGVCVFRSTITDAAGNVLAVGHAYEKENSSFINKTSYIENCETSAVGRALGFLGIGIDTSIASYEEVANAIENQKPKTTKMSDDEVVKFNDFLVSYGADATKIIRDHKVKTLGDFTKEEAKQIMLDVKKAFNEKKDEGEKYE